MSAYILAVACCSAGCDSGGTSDQTDGGAGDGAADAVTPQFFDSGQWTCSGDQDCDDGKVCHPYARFCVAPGAACSAHAECPEDSYCDPEKKVCLTGTTGSPCATDDNCTDSCTGGFCGCDGLVQEQQLGSAGLDVYFIMDRTGSMGDDCDYVAGGTPPVDSKACFATYSIPDYLINVKPEADTRLALHFMTQPRDCDGTAYETPLIGLTQLPVAANHPLVQAISDEDFGGGFGTLIEGALRGLTSFTAAARTPGREMIGVLMTDGDANGCEVELSKLGAILADHLAKTGIRTFIIGMQGATEENLEALARAGGAEPHGDWCGGITPPCHYWNVGEGSGDAIASALAAIIRQATPLPCQFSVADLEAPADQELDYNTVNVTLTEDDVDTTIGQVPSAADCPSDQPAWHYDSPVAPTQIHLCPTACELVSGAADGARVSAVVGCRTTVTLH